MCVFFFTPLLNPGISRPFDIDPFSSSSLYLLCSRRPYGGRLVYYLSISSAGPVGLCLPTTAAGRAEFNWNRVGFGGKARQLCFVLWRSDPIAMSQVSPVWKVLKESHRLAPRPDPLQDESIGITAFIDYCRIHFFCRFFQGVAAGRGEQRDIPPLFFYHGG